MQEKVTVPEHPEQGRSIDRRRRTRQTCDLPGSFQPIGGDPEFRRRGVIRDISTDGLGLLLSRRFEPGTFLALELSAGPAQPQRRLLARVAWVKGLSPRQWRLGCAFAYRLSEDDVLALVRGV